MTKHILIAALVTGTALTLTAQTAHPSFELSRDEKPCNIPGNSCEGTSYVDTSQSLSSGTHTLTFKLWDNAGKVYTAQKSVTVD